MPRDHLFTIHGQKWLLRFTRLRGSAAGWAYLPDSKNPGMERKILIDEKLKGRSLLETTVHELIHVSFPTASEEHVTEAAHDIGRILWTLGYRISE